MIGVLLAVVLSQAEPDAGVETEAVVVDAGVPPPAPVPVAEAPTAHWALWAQPLGTAGYGAGGPLANAGAVGQPILIYVPVGVNIVLSKVELVVELTVTGQMSGSFLPPRVGAWLSAGPLWHLGPNPLNGFFIQPKLLGAFMVSAGNAQCGGFCGNPDQALGAIGLDVGYQLTFRHLYVAFVAGFGMGAGNFPNMQVVTPWAAVNGSFSGVAPTVEPVVLVNLNLLRIGGWN